MYLYLYFSPQTHMNTKSISTVLTLSAQNELCCCVFSFYHHIKDESTDNVIFCLQTFNSRRNLIHQSA